MASTYRQPARLAPSSQPKRCEDPANQVPRMAKLAVCRDGTTCVYDEQLAREVLGLPPMKPIVGDGASESELFRIEAIGTQPSDIVTRSTEPSDIEARGTEPSDIEVSGTESLDAEACGTKLRALRPAAIGPSRRVKLSASPRGTEPLDTGACGTEPSDSEARSTEPLDTEARGTKVPAIRLASIRAEQTFRLFLCAVARHACSVAHRALHRHHLHGRRRERHRRRHVCMPKPQASECGQGAKRPGRGDGCGTAGRPASNRSRIVQCWHEAVHHRHHHQQARPHSGTNTIACKQVRPTWQQPGGIRTPVSARVASQQGVAHESAPRP